MNRKNLIVSTIAMLMVAVVALTTASFAWFNLTVEPYVQEFDTTVISGNSLQIGLTHNGTFSNYLPISAFNASYASFPTLEMDAATPQYVTGDSAKLSLNPSLRTLTFLTSVSDITAEVGLIKGAETVNINGSNFYVNLNMFVRANTAMPVSVILNSADAGGVVESIFTTKVNESADPTPTIDIQRSLRIAFVSTKVDAAGVYSGQSIVKIYEPMAAGATVYETGKNITESIEVPSEVALTPNQTQTTVDPETDYNKYTREITTELIAGSKQTMQLFETEESFETWQVRIYIWIEGFDGDCNGLTASSLFSTLIRFIGE